MERLSARRLVWGVNRWILVAGPAAWVLMAGMLLLALLCAGLWSSLTQLHQHERTLAALVAEPAGPAFGGRGEDSHELSLPPLEQRFEVNRRVLAALAESGLEPDQIQFKFETAEEAGLTRQVAVFTLESEWEQISQTLQRLQAADRTIHISRLTLAREAPGAGLVTAEVQLGALFAEADVRRYGEGP